MAGSCPVAARSAPRSLSKSKLAKVLGASGGSLLIFRYISTLFCRLRSAR